MRTRTLVALTTLLALAGGCREGVGIYTPGERELPAGALVRLTFNTADERDPHFLPGGDDIVFHTDHWWDSPLPGGTLVRMPAEGGVATRVAPVTVAGLPPTLMLPVPSPDGSRIAYLHVIRSALPQECAAVAGGACELPTPRLDSVMLRVRPQGSLAPPSADPGVGLLLDGIARDGIEDRVQRLHPFHLDHLLRNEVTGLRASWAPDGGRLVLSDGLQLLQWRPGESAPEPIPNSADGSAPAWSPGGEWIAFTRVERGAPYTVVCSCGDPTIPDNIVTRVGWPIAAQTIAVIRPDGSGLRILAPGSEPAWSPDGTTLFYRNGDNGLFRIPFEGGTPSPLPGTTGARAPAIAPDGASLAFARRGAGAGHFDLWRLQLQP